MRGGKKENIFHPGFSDLSGALKKRISQPLWFGTFTIQSEISTINHTTLNRVIVNSSKIVRSVKCLIKLLMQFPWLWTSGFPGGGYLGRGEVIYCLETHVVVCPKNVPTSCHLWQPRDDDGKSFRWKTSGAAPAAVYRVTLCSEHQHCLDVSLKHLSLHPRHQSQWTEVNWGEPLQWFPVSALFIISVYWQCVKACAVPTYWCSGLLYST